MRDFNKVKIQLASPEKIRSWSYGEVEKPETINYRTLKPERDGLFDERIFGPEKDYECACGKYKRQRYEGKVCERCGVEVTKRIVRRYRMGHIELATPAAHIWYVKDIPSKIGTLLDLSAGQLEQVLYFGKFIVTDPQGAIKDGRPLKKGELLSDEEYRELRLGKQETYSLQVGTHAEVRDGEYVTRGQKLGGNVVSKMDGVAQYRFPRKATLGYHQSGEASFTLPKGITLDLENYRAGEEICDGLEEHSILASRDGVVSVQELGEGYGRGGVVIEVKDVDDEKLLERVFVPMGFEVLVGDGEQVESDTELARANGDLVRMPRGASAEGVSSKKQGSNIRVTLTLKWELEKSIEINPTMHVLVGDGAEFSAGDRLIGAIDAAQEVIAEADGTLMLQEPASIIVSRAKLYKYEDEPIVVNGDRVQPGDDLADKGNLKSEIHGRIEIDLVRRQVRVVEAYDFEARMGAEAVRELLEGISLEALEAELGEMVNKANNPSQHKRAKARKRLEVVRSFKRSGNRPEWMILDSVPIMPPDLRPMVQVEGGRFATSDLNDLYRRLINRNNRLKKLMTTGAPEMIVRNEKRMLQEAVDALIDNGRRGTPVTHPGSDRPLRSLTDLLGGKQGRFRQNLLGKRVDYSGRSVIVVGPQLRLHQCGLPKRMALELFKPFLFKVLEEKGVVTNIKQARKLLERYRDTRDEIWDALEEVIQDKVVLLNRAPTLHRLGIQAFTPVLVEGQAIQLHPLVCEAFNADFDGDQMAIHVPLSPYAQAEARVQMLSAHNLLSPANGEPNVKPAKDIILGIYTLTQPRPGFKGVGLSFKDQAAALEAHKQNKIDLNAKISVNGKDTTVGAIKYVFSNLDEALQAVNRGEIDTQDSVSIRLDLADGTRVVETTTGRALFRRMVNETITEDGGVLSREYVNLNTTYGKTPLTDMVIDIFKTMGVEKTANILDALKSSGFKLASTSGVTVGIDDAVIPAEKLELLEKADAELERINEDSDLGLVTEEERYRQVVTLWTNTTEEVTNAAYANFEKNLPLNPFYVMSQSGARGNKQQLRQLMGMRGLMQKPNGDTIELPIRTNFREGLNVLEYFTSTHGARKGGADTALRTADSGYLTRKLHDVAHEIVVREPDCGTSDFLNLPLLETDGKPRKAADIEMGLYGRFLGADLELGGQTLSEGTMLNSDEVKLILKHREELTTVPVRSPITCRTRAGVCQKCYGYDLSQAKLVSKGEAVGVIAAQSIGEPGTQLTMRTFHTGGVAGAQDITLGLPRVVELFEARKPKVKATLSEIDGVVSIADEDSSDKIILTVAEGDFSKKYKVERTARLLVREGDRVEAGQSMTRGAINPEDLLESKGVEAAQRYLVDGIQQVYRQQGVKLHDKHIELIVRQMFKYVEILEDTGDSEFLEGQVLEKFDVETENERLEAAGKNPASWKPKLMGITKSALSTKSWLSAASFQHTTHVLTEASVSGKVDELIGLKENVILGKLIPAGTGLSEVKEIQVLDDRLREKVLEGNDRAARLAQSGNAQVPQPGAGDD